jgi:PEP-CTERM motif
MKKALLLASAVVALGAASTANAAVIVVGGGWTTVGFGAAGSALNIGGDNVFTFTLPTPGKLRITDAFLIGDIFRLTINGVVLGPTSAPGAGANVGGDYDAAFASGYYSAGEYDLLAGNFTVTGTATVSPFNGGDAGLRVDLAAIPEPGTWALMIMGFGLAGGALRRTRGQTVRLTYS